jgi:hypothetical protein
MVESILPADNEIQLFLLILCSITNQITATSFLIFSDSLVINHSTTPSAISGVPRGGGGGFNRPPPKLLSFYKAELNFKFRGK